MSEQQLDANLVIDRLGRQIGDLVVQLAMKDAQIEELTARLQVMQAASEPT
jgi:hypothetical protein